MRRRLGMSIAEVTLSLSVSACASTSVGGPAPTPTAPPAPAVRVPASSPSPVLDVSALQPSSSSPEATAAAAAARADAAARAGTSLADVHVERVEPREWGDSSLGCPQPDQMYSQIVTPGYLLVVTTGTQTFEYHSDARGHVVLCQQR